jgi:hypothetical protein
MLSRALVKAGSSASIWFPSRVLTDCYVETNSVVISTVISHVSVVTAIATELVGVRFVCFLSRAFFNIIQAKEPI